MGGVLFWGGGKTAFRKWGREGTNGGGDGGGGETACRKWGGREGWGLFRWGWVGGLRLNRSTL